MIKPWFRSKQARKTLDNVETIQSAINNLRWAKRNLPSFETHPVFAVVQEKPRGAVLPPNDDVEGEFMELVRMWRLDHPEPESGRLHLLVTLDSKKRRLK